MDQLYRATRALHFTGTASLEQAIDWIMKHQDDADVDEPLMVDKVGFALNFHVLCSIHMCADNGGFTKGHCRAWA